MSDKQCSICKSKDSLRHAPIMTGIPFSAPPEQQVVVCVPCIDAWYEGAGTKPEEILKARGLMEQAK